MKHAIRSSHVKNFHLPLSEEVHEALRSEAARLKKPATVVAREAIEEWLRERRRSVVREAVAAYAAQQAGTTADLDPSLERAALELWREGKRRKR
jgi:predicted transcriptional regulator